MMKHLCGYEAQTDMQFIRNSSVFRVAKGNSNTPFIYLLVLFNLLSSTPKLPPA
ncbi:rCG38991, partial [Rattus norvegicus]